MQFGNTVITTPLDDKVQYDPAWRNAFCTAWLDYPDARIDSEFMCYKRDPWILKQREYLRACREGRPLTQEQKSLRLASRWYQSNRPSDVKFKLEPLLLTPISFAIIALDIGGNTVDPFVFQAYEALYFNVRMPNGQMHESCALRQYFACPNGHIGRDTPYEVIWRMIGANQGYEALVSVWMWSHAHGLNQVDEGYMLQELWRVAQSTAFIDAYNRRVGHTDLVSLMGKVTEQNRMQRETNSSAVQGLETVKTMAAMMYMTRPQLLAAGRDVDANNEKTAAMQGRLKAQKNIGVQSVIDAGSEVGVEHLNTLISSQFKNQKAME